jgi:hypothetical protein
MLDRIGLVLAIWKRFFRVKVLLRRQTVAAVAVALGERPDQARRFRNPLNLGRAVWKALSFGPFHPRCLPVALVHYRLLIEQGLPAQLVIGIPEESESVDAHAWVDVDGIDVGPPPGRGGRLVMARYGPGGPQGP